MPRISHPAQPVPDAGALRLPQYTTAWIIATRDYYMLTGDRRFAHLMMPWSAGRSPPSWRTWTVVFSARHRSQ